MNIRQDLKSISCHSRQCIAEVGGVRGVKYETSFAYEEGEREIESAV